MEQPWDASISEREPRKGTETLHHRLSPFPSSGFQNVNPERGRKLKLKEINAKLRDDDFRTRTPKGDGNSRENNSIT